jgi:hypothetical protein
MKSNKILNLLKWILPIWSLLLFSCLKEDTPIKLPENQRLSQQYIGRDGTGGVYDYEYYFDFSENKAYEVPLAAYDLAFETNPSAVNIRLNTGKYMFAWRTDSTRLESTFDIQQGVWVTDAPGGSIDSLALKDWFDVKTKQTNGFVYIIDRGTLYHTKRSERYRKLTIESVNDKQYTIRYGALDATNYQEFIIPKDTTYTLTYFSFENGGKVVKVAPPKANWDIVFTNYIHIFNDQTPEFKNYLVRGVLSNHLYRTLSTGIENQFDQFPSFDAFSYKDIDLLVSKGKGLSAKANAIGYDWKKFDLQGNYVLAKNNYYLVKDAEGKIYKLRFYDFYSKDGKKGFPQFEFDQL